MKASIDKIVLNFKIPSGTIREISKEKYSWILIISDENILLAALALAYMILFGHSLPTRVNKNIF